MAGGERLRHSQLRGGRGGAAAHGAGGAGKPAGGVREPTWVTRGAGGAGSAPPRSPAASPFRRAQTQSVATQAGRAPRLVVSGDFSTNERRASQALPGAGGGDAPPRQQPSKWAYRRHAATAHETGPAGQGHPAGGRAGGGLRGGSSDSRCRGVRTMAAAVSPAPDTRADGAAWRRP